ncbi:FecR family protein [Pedobacter sp. AW31-3R]|uniref:FecR family protein n=1 Tax=Pedobacter sp. AW31-3R TaxID=3445781 RepID=UPI003F9F577D
MDVPEHIKFLVLKWRKRNLSEDERAELDAWYNAALPEKLYMEAEGEQELKHKLLSRIKNELGDGKKMVVRKLHIWTKVAAAVVLIGGLSLLVVQSLDKVDRPLGSRVAQSENEIKRIILPDSSIVWLKKNSHLVYPAAFANNSREVELDGEALFEITHNKLRPFKIRSGNYVTTVLGTSFNLKTGKKDEDFVISVLTGKVQVVKKTTDKEPGVYFVSANESFHADAGKVAKLTDNSRQEQVSELIKGTQYNMNFEMTSFETIMKQFELKFGVELEGYTGEYSSCQITADLTNLPLEKSLDIICSAMNATYKISNNKIKIAGGGCF